MDMEKMVKAVKIHIAKEIKRCNEQEKRRDEQEKKEGKQQPQTKEGI